MIDDQQKDGLCREKDARQCRRILIDHLLKSTAKHAFASFLVALDSSGQEDIRADLENHPEGRTLEKKRQLWEWQIRLKKCHPALVERIACRSEFLDFFFQEKILTEDEMQMIEYEPTETRKTLKFLNTLHNKPPKAYTVLVDALQQDESYCDLVDSISGIDLTRDDWEQHSGEY